MDITITLTLTREEWMTLLRTLWRGVSAFSEDISFVVKAQIAMDLNEQEMRSITRPRVKKLDAWEKAARQVTMKVHEMMLSQFGKDSLEE